MTPEATRLFLGLLAVLGLASLIAAILSWRSPKPIPATLSNLNARIRKVIGIAAPGLIAGQ